MIAQQIVSDLLGGKGTRSEAARRTLKLTARHQLFPQVYRIVDQYVEARIDTRGQDLREIGLLKYFNQIVERLRDRIEPDTAVGETPLVPILNRHKPIGTTAEVDFTTTRACRATTRSHIDQVVLDTETWESSAAFWLEACPFVYSYARNDNLGLVIPYQHEGVDHQYTPDFLVRYKDTADWTQESKQFTVVLEIKGYLSPQDEAKHSAARKWVSAVNNWGELGQWAFHVCADPQLLPKELAAHVQTAPAVRAAALTRVGSS
jgi:type III restriction enzyme